MHIIFQKMLLCNTVYGLWHNFERICAIYPFVCLIVITYTVKESLCQFVLLMVNVNG